MARSISKPQAQRIDLKPLRQIGLQRLGNCEDRGGRIRQGQGTTTGVSTVGINGWNVIRTPQVGEIRQSRRSRATFQLLPQPASASRISILGRAVVDFVPVMFYI